MEKAKPFIKWAGGKSKLLSQLDALLPADFAERRNIQYVEPFVGGGAMLFYLLQTYPNITAALINDINPDLATCYKVVRDNPADLIKSLEQIQTEYYALHDEALRKTFFLKQRERFNSKLLDPIENTTLFIFLNKTCFNGLYRVNKSGGFNVPFGRYSRPNICDAETIIADSELLQKVEIMTGDFEQTFSRIGSDTFFYFDPPYRPISATSNFTDYAKESFNDDEQIRLKLFCDKLNDCDIQFMLSNSDSPGTNTDAGFFDCLYAGYSIKRVWASRSVNSIATKRNKITEIVVRNYSVSQQHSTTNIHTSLQS